jgi:hypothetical protein
VPPQLKNSRLSLWLSLESGRRALTCWSGSGCHYLPRRQA